MRSMKFVNRLKKMYGKSSILPKLAKLPIIKQRAQKLVKHDKLIFLTDDRVVPVNVEVEKQADMILPSKVVEYFIGKAKNLWLMNFCICREGKHCKKYPHELGCLFMGDAVLNINPEIGRLVSKEEALAHIKKCGELGLVHTIGRNKLDSWWLDATPEEKLLTVCNCCECCCIAKLFAKMGPKIRSAAVKMPGVTVRVTDKCKGCGLCTKDLCIFNAIKLVDKRAVIGEECRACGRCANKCPNKAIEVIIDDKNFIKDSIEQIEKLVDIT